MATLAAICDAIILISAVIAAITAILKVIGKPITFFQKKQDEEFNKRFKIALEAQLPEVLKNDKVSSLILKEIMPILIEIKKMNEEQNKKIETMQNSSKDILRDKIMDIYNKGKADQKITVLDRERLNQYYKDYKAEDGNTYIDKYFARMKNWETVYE